MRLEHARKVVGAAANMATTAAKANVRKGKAVAHWVAGATWLCGICAALIGVAAFDAVYQKGVEAWRNRASTSGF